MQNLQKLQFNAPSLPTGGGAINGLTGSISAAGPDGAVSLSVPLPFSSGRGYAPELALNYHSRSGNGPLGIGWNINTPTINRRTNKGAPAYQATDELLGPDGEVLVPQLSVEGKSEQREANTLLGVDLGGTFIVYSYRSRVESTFSRLEHWVPRSGAESDFWVMYSPNGQIHLFGRNLHARISNPQTLSETAVWLLESSVSAAGEQIYYRYRPEDEINCSVDEIKKHAGASAQRYLATVYYGNIKAGRILPGIVGAPAASDWLFMLTLDYGEQTTSLSQVPVWQTPGTGKWLCRQDCFSTYEYGFEQRTRRLCRQALMFHRVKTLADKAQGDDKPFLVSRLLLEYDENPSVSTLISVRQVAYDPSNSPPMQALPPFEFGWQFFTVPQTPTWQQRDDLNNLNPQQPYQFVDLNGEGLGGILYQDRDAWWYRAPVRKTDNPDMNAVGWSKSKLLPSIPSLKNSAILTDLNGDGRLQWVVTTPAGAGHYSRTQQAEWLHFTPLCALPLEYANPRAQLADILGAGLSDIVLIGPRSVRLYAGNGKGWTTGQTVIQSDGVTLPVPGADARAMVAFSDLPGSGQQHLVEVKANGVRYWPNLGHGRFGRPVDMPGFNQSPATFNPDRVFLADIDGSGTTDLIYACTDRLKIYLNQSGNRFAPPFTIALPSGVRYDHTSSLQVGAFQGLGVASLLLSVSHPLPRHWLCHLVTDKPWLLNTMNNNMGAHHIWRYRSSVQFWLDEKNQAETQGKPELNCYLPFPVHTLWQTETADEITGNRLISEVRYRQGVWDGREREFCGFAYLEIQDTNMAATQATATQLTAPCLTRSWFYTGLPEVDERLAQEYWQADQSSFKRFTPRFTTGNGNNEQCYVPDDGTAFWLRRALRGNILRSELYGQDDSMQSSVPYTVTENRPQVRMVQANGRYPVVWPFQAETRTYTYERIRTDPQCAQSILLASDEYGKPLRQVSISYPRRNKPADNPYPETLPATLFDASYDQQQQVLRLGLVQTSWHHLVDTKSGICMLGLPDGSRSDEFTQPAGNVPDSGLTLELLQQKDSLISESRPYTFMGQEQIGYLDAESKPTLTKPALPARVAFTVSAVLDEDMVKKLSGAITAEMLEAAGYKESSYLFARTGETQLWVMHRSHTAYDTADHFWLPVSYQETLLIDPVSFCRDKHDCAVIKYQDASGLTIQAKYDYRFLVPVKLIDINDNIHVVTLDALGRVTSNRFKGTEAGTAKGYSAAEFDEFEDVDSALQLSAPLPVAQYLKIVSNSWMPKAGDDVLKRIISSVDVDTARKALLAAKVLTEDGRLRALALQRPLTSELARWAKSLRAILPHIPPHVLSLTTDRYDSDPAQQIRQQVAFSDGFGRVLQNSVRQAAGEALQRAEDGSLITDLNGTPQTTATDFRWTVTGRTEYNNKGQPVRVYQPYFLNDWRYVSDDTARSDLYADTYFYDPTGRSYQIRTANGYLRRQFFTPWFTVSEDENDTLA